MWSKISGFFRSVKNWIWKGLVKTSRALRGLGILCGAIVGGFEVKKGYDGGIRFSIPHLGGFFAALGIGLYVGLILLAFGFPGWHLLIGGCVALFLNILFHLEDASVAWEYIQATGMVDLAAETKVAQVKASAASARAEMIKELGDQATKLANAEASAPQLAQQANLQITGANEVMSKKEEMRELVKNLLHTPLLEEK